MRTAQHVRNEGFAARATGVRALLGVALALAVAGGLVVVTDDGGEDGESAVEAERAGEDATGTSTSSTSPDDAPTEVSDPEGSTIPTVSVAERPSSRLEPLITGTPRSSRPAPRTPATTAPAGCRNAVAADVDDPSECGPFRWDPAPANRPAELEVIVSHGQAPVGQPVTFTTRWADPDAPRGHIRISGLAPGCAEDCPAANPPACADDRIGPWDPPRAVAGSDDFLHTVDDLAPGTYEWAVTLTTSSVGDDLAGCERDPYASTATVTGTLVVHPLLLSPDDGG